MSHHEPLPIAALRKRCDPADLPFRTTAELPDLDQALGQERGLEALQFGMSMARRGYNLYVLGPPGIGKHALVQHVLRQRAAREPAPADWCYVNNFTDPQHPQALALPAGRGEGLRQDMARLIEELADAIPAAFESDDYRAQLQAIKADYERQSEDKVRSLQEHAAEQNIALLRTPTGFAFAPLKDGEVIGPDEFGKLSEREQRRIETTMEELQDELRALIQHQLRLRREMRERVRALNREVALLAVGQQLAELKQAYQDCPAVLDYLDAVQADVMQNLDAFRHGEEGAAAPESLPPEVARRYAVNVLVSNDPAAGAPVVQEDHPLYQNLLGRVEHQAQMGMLVTDFTLIRPGALHKANGGYLILDVTKLLMQPYAWEGLKRTLFSGDIRITSLGELFSLVSTVSLEPEPIPLRVKVVLLGSRQLYYVLCQYDPEFRALFKVAADLEDDVARSPENHLRYARLIAMIARREALRPLSSEAVAGIIEQAARLAEDGARLSIHLQDLGELLQEANFLAGEADAAVIEADHVRSAIQARERRHGRIRERLLEQIRRQTVLIDTDGAQVGQINGLSVLDLGDFRFARPSRITATARLGTGDVVDIEREVELGGPIHSKGVMILASFLGGRYAPDRPLSLRASIVFEQSYGPVEGDSASAAELCALLSALGELPLKQSLAITGSVNQHGQIQAIGGVNEKIEGFFDACHLRGLTGRQGVIIPGANVQHLMLRQDVLDAVAQGLFAVYAVSHIDEAMELLTGLAAGAREATGQFPDGSINQRVEARLLELAELRQALAARTERGEET
ncbi:MAG TPA: ATP-binding protein [Nevskiales bacterium]|nr:ATP-binding protein [Nevskiales bacterium]